MIHFYILFLLLLFQACTPKHSDKPSFLFILETVNSLSNKPSITSLDVSKDVFEDKINTSSEWTVFNGKAPDALTMRSKLAIDQTWGFTYVVMDQDGDLYIDNKAREVHPTKNLILQKYDSTRNTIWTKEIGIPGSILKVGGIWFDQITHTIYITGSTDGFFAKKPNENSQDLFVIKLDSNGNILWKKQINTPGQNRFVSPTAITVDIFRNVWVTGTTNAPFGGNYDMHGNAFIAVFNQEGKQILLKQIAIQGAQIFPTGLAYSRNYGKIYMVGSAINANFRTNKPNFLKDNHINFRSSLFVLEYDIYSSLLKGDYKIILEMGGTNIDQYEGNSITVDREGDILIAGNRLNMKPNNDGILLGRSGILMKILNPNRFNGPYNEPWTIDLGKTQEGDTIITAITTDSVGNVFTTGSANENLQGEGNSAGKEDLFLTKHSSSGRKVWIKQIGSSHPDTCTYGTGIGVWKQDLYLVGTTTGAINELPVKGGIDQFVMKLKQE
ncbi:SBBP repeat-containing protein [Leptospira kirschneri]|uniref:Beta-propeller repeat protein n=1 Tax=Leptospira kirschneri serovar Bulgarica str. Nikolaevo TaxID=1240687 RepID=M6F4Y2_9LEPT|nr:SBBP repeat-containing protein [Leptospira kirschneri]EMK23858.1 beta-propeller repeat protein [Leptospira kirschneri serovar Bulgarica str. Nikolaevo]